MQKFKSNDRFFKEHRRCKEVLSKLKIYHLYSQLPKHLRELLLNAQLPEPVVVLDPSAMGYSGSAGMQQAVQNLLREKEMALEYHDTTMVLGDFCRVLVGLSSVLGRLTLDPAVGRFVLPLHGAVEQVVQRYSEQWDKTLHVKVLVELLEHIDVTQRLLWHEGKYVRRENAKGRLEIVLHALTPDVEHISLDGLPRKAYRCYLLHPGSKPKPIEWPASLCGGVAHGRSLPVYIQQHAIDRLESRTQPWGFPAGLNLEMMVAIAKHAVAKHQGDSIWIDFTYFGSKLGYFVAKRVHGKFLIRTFDFITMQGTPEATELLRQLRLTRSEIEFNYLDRLSTFTDTDLKDDPDIVRVLSRCGLGHLFKTIAGRVTNNMPAPFASQLRRYLGL